MASSWKYFNFYSDVSGESNEEEEEMFKGITAIVVEKNTALVGDDLSRLLCYDVTHAAPELRWEAETGHSVGYMGYLERRSDFIWTVSDEEMKVWSVVQQQHRCLCTLVIGTGFPVTAATVALTVDGQQHHMAIGYADGTVNLIRLGSKATNFSKPMRSSTVFESKEPVTGVAFAQTFLFIATTNRIVKVSSTTNKSLLKAKLVDALGCALGCFGHQDDQIVVARDDGLYLYDCGSQGEHTHVPFDVDAGTDSPPTLQRMVVLNNGYVALCHTVQKEERSVVSYDLSRVTVLDMANKLVVHSSNLPFLVNHLIARGNGVWALAQDGKRAMLEEKDLASKVSILCSRDLYDLALTLAGNEPSEEPARKQIHASYADFLCAQGEYEAGMQQYLLALPIINTSTVVRKFLDGQHLKTLTRFLEELHSRKCVPSSEYTVLLLNCYAKAKQIDQLQSFIETESLDTVDVDTAINVCRAGRLYAQAAYLAKRYHEDETYISIQIEHLKDYALALDFIRHLSASVVGRNLHAYGFVLMKELPTETTDLFIEYYKGEYREKVATSDKESLLQPLSGNSFLPKVTSYIPYLSSTTSPPASASSSRQNVPSISRPLPAEEPKYQPPRPRSAFPFFADHPQMFIRFLEALADSDPPDQAVMSTLFEMYLKVGDLDGSDQRARALDILAASDDATFTNQALLLSHMASFGLGLQVSIEKGGHQVDLFRGHIEQKDTRAVLDDLEKYGAEFPEIYSVALRYFCSSQEVFMETRHNLANILEHIGSHGLMTPLEVILVIGQNDVADLGVVKAYLMKQTSREKREIDNVWKNLTFWS